MSRFNDLNEVFCENLKKLFALASNSYEKAIEIKNKYSEYMGITEQIQFLVLDYELNAIQEADAEFYSKYTSPMKEGNDGFWYFGFLLKFIKYEQDSTFVKSAYPVILGVKLLKNGSYELKIKDDKETLIKEDANLVYFFENINNKIKNSLNENLSLVLNSSKKIGF